MRIESLEGRTLLSSAIDPISVLIGGAAAKAVQFTDAGGTKATIQVTGGGSATVTFEGNSLSQGVGAAGIVVNGTDVTLSSVALAGTGLNTTLQITTGGRGSITAGGITSTGVMGSILAPGVVVDGDITLAGWIHQIVLGGAENGTINIGPSKIGGGLTLVLGSANNENLISAVRINSLTSNQWVNTTGGPEMIQAPQLLSTNVSGSFTPDLTLTGMPGATSTMNSFAVGAILGGSWSVAGNVQRIQAGSIAAGWTAAIGGNISGINIAHDASVDLTASTIGSMIVHGSLSDSTITLNQPLAAVGNDLNSLWVGGAIISTTLRAIGSLGAITATRMQDSQIYAGLMPLPAGQGLPQAPTDFANVAQINSVTLRRSASASFAGSDIAAYGLGKIVLGTVAMSNGGTPFGLAAHNIKSVSLTDQTTNKNAQQSTVPSTTSFSNVLVSKGILAVDFVVDVL
jgi:hypothetical protein